MSKAEAIIKGLGGAENIVEIEACITRLRTEVKDGAKVNESALKAAGAHIADTPAEIGDVTRAVLGRR